MKLPRCVMSTAWMLVVSLFTFTSLQSQAALVYDVYDTGRVNCAGAPHGLWTNVDQGRPSCSANYFSIQEGTRLVIDGDEAKLTGSAANPLGTIAKIDLTFSSFAETYKYKREGGIAWSPLDDTPDIDFFTQVLGTIAIEDDIYLIDGLAGGFGFQYGLGANAKRADEYGASAWVKSSLGCNQRGIQSEYSCLRSSHWDINIKLKQVPEGGTLGMLGLGVIALGLMRRTRRAVRHAA